MKFTLKALFVAIVATTPAFNISAAKEKDADLDDMPSLSMKRSMPQNDYSISCLQEAPEKIDWLLADGASKQEAEWLTKVKRAIAPMCKAKPSPKAAAKAWEMVDAAVADLGVVQGSRHAHEVDPALLCCPSLRSAIVHLLLEIQHELRQCCQDLAALIESKLPCNSPIAISEVPVEIHIPGNYCVTANLNYAGSDAAIKVLSNNVTLDFDNHDLLLQDTTQSIGILVEDVQNVTIKNANISLEQQALVNTVRGIQLRRSANVAIQNANIHNPYYGVRADFVNDLTVSDLYSTEALGGNIRVLDSNAVTIKDSACNNTLENLEIAGIRLDRSTNLELSNLQLFNSDIFWATGTNVNFNNINSVINDPTYIFNNLQIGSRTAATSTFYISNSTFSNISNSTTAPNGNILIAQASNGIIENCVAQNTSTGVGVETNSIAIQIGSSAGLVNPTSHNINISNCVATVIGGNPVTIFTAGSDKHSNITIQNCSISGGDLDAVAVVNTQASSIIGNTISNNAGWGVSLLNNTTTVDVYNNTITNNGLGGVYIDKSSRINNVTDNRIFGNGGIAICDACDPDNNINPNIIFGNKPSLCY